MQRDRSRHPGGYEVGEAARLLGLTVQQVRAYARAGILEPRPGGELRLSFRDLVLLRLVKGLSASRIPARRVRRALERLRSQLATDRPLSGVRLAAAGRQLVAREGANVWNPESGQCLLDFEGGPGRAAVVTLPPEAEPELALVMEAEDWYLLGCELEEHEPEQAREAYQRAVEVDPSHAEAHINLGCFYHAAGKLQDAEAHYRAALRSRPEDDTAAFDLGVVLEDQERDAEAEEAYRIAVRANPRCADAHYNLARLYDRRGETAAAIRHLKAYRSLHPDR